MDALRGRVCVVTGANSGMGRVTAGALAAEGATVVLLCRDGGRGEAARAEIARETGSETVELVVADLASNRQVRDAAAEIAARHEHVHVLVNNAGSFLARRDVTGDGVERTLAANYLGHFLLTAELLDALQGAAPARIVNVTSRTGRARIDLDDLDFSRRKYTALAATTRSKLATVLWTVELADRLAGSGVTANAVHPGLARTGVARELPWAVRALLRVVSTTAEKGARTTIRAASAPELEAVSGRFLGPGGKELALPAQARDENARRRLWEESARLAQLEPAPV
jgi:NAD(P)-dependent dehydrogenase (short-subunit alcohol dehydrogenase family)